MQYSHNPAKNLVFQGYFRKIQIWHYVILDKTQNQ